MFRLIFFRRQFSYRTVYRDPVPGRLNHEISLAHDAALHRQPVIAGDESVDLRKKDCIGKRLCDIFVRADSVAFHDDVLCI